MRIDIFKRSADQLFDNLGINNTKVGWGDGGGKPLKTLSPNPQVAYNGIQSPGTVQSALTIPQGYVTYTIRLPDDTLKAFFGSSQKILDAVRPEEIWWVDRTDGFSWRRCHSAGTSDFNTIGTYGLVVYELGPSDYGV